MKTAITAAAVALSLLAAGCGGSSGEKVAQVGTTSAGKSATPARFTSCMRSHGVPSFPDPGADGMIQVPSTIDDGSPIVRAAYRACHSLAPSESSITGQGDTMSQDQLLAFAKCMRSHGVPKFPDPQVVNGHINMHVTAGQIDPRSPTVTAATAACRGKLGPAGLRGAEKLVNGPLGTGPAGKGGKGK
jgi:hypothetical protein